MRFSVIMPVYLGDYPQRATNPADKFKRAVTSFLDQEFKDAELIIIADGCEQARQIYAENFAGFSNIRFAFIDKQPLFSGKVRQRGIEMAVGDRVCYLDADDFFGREHLKIIDYNWNTDFYDWVYFDDYVVGDSEFHSSIRSVQLAPCYIGTSNISHKRSVELVWADGYGHDWSIIEKYLLNRNGVRIGMPQYYVCHRPGMIDF